MLYKEERQNAGTFKPASENLFNVGNYLYSFRDCASFLSDYYKGSCVLSFGRADSGIRNHTCSEFFHSYGNVKVFQGDLITGLISTIIGIFIIARAELVVSVFPFVLGIVIAVNGVLNIGKSLELKALGYKKWVAVLVMAVLTAALGLLLVFNPLKAADFAISLVGIGLIVTGICDIWAASRAGKILSEEEPRVIIMNDDIEL